MSANNFDGQTSRLDHIVRPLSEMMVDLHIYRIPNEFWVAERRLAKNQAIDSSISAGFIRILPELTLRDVRKEITHQLGYETLPADYIFLRSIGRNFAKVRIKQENHFKAKIFIPPLALEPELYLLENPNNFLSGLLAPPEAEVAKHKTETSFKLRKSRITSRDERRRSLGMDRNSNTSSVNSMAVEIGTGTGTNTPTLLQPPLSSLETGSDQHRHQRHHSTFRVDITKVPLVTIRLPRMGRRRARSAISTSSSFIRRHSGKLVAYQVDDVCLYNDDDDYDDYIDDYIDDDQDILSRKNNRFVHVDSTPSSGGNTPLPQLTVQTNNAQNNAQSVKNVAKTTTGTQLMMNDGIRPKATDTTTNSITTCIDDRANSKIISKKENGDDDDHNNNNNNNNEGNNKEIIFSIDDLGKNNLNMASNGGEHCQEKMAPNRQPSIVTNENSIDNEPLITEWDLRDGATVAVKPNLTKKKPKIKIKSKMFSKNSTNKEKENGGSNDVIVIDKAPKDDDSEASDVNVTSKVENFKNFKASRIARLNKETNRSDLKIDSTNDQSISNKIKRLSANIADDILTNTMTNVKSKIPIKSMRFRPNAAHPDHNLKRNRSIDIIDTETKTATLKAKSEDEEMDVIVHLLDSGLRDKHVIQLIDDNVRADIKVNNDPILKADDNKSKRKHESKTIVNKSHYDDVNVEVKTETGSRTNIDNRNKHLTIPTLSIDRINKEANDDWSKMANYIKTNGQIIKVEKFQMDKLKAENDEIIAENVPRNLQKKSKESNKNYEQKSLKMIEEKSQKIEDEKSAPNQDLKSPNFVMDKPEEIQEQKLQKIEKQKQKNIDEKFQNCEQEKSHKHLKEISQKVKNEESQKIKEKRVQKNHKEKSQNEKEIENIIENQQNNSTEKSPKISEEFSMQINEEKSPNTESKISLNFQKENSQTNKSIQINENFLKIKENFQKTADEKLSKRKENFLKPPNIKDENIQRFKENFKKTKQEKLSKSEENFQKIKEEKPIKQLEKFSSPQTIEEKSPNIESKISQNCQNIQNKEQLQVNEKDGNLQKINVETPDKTETEILPKRPKAKEFKSSKIEEDKSTRIKENFRKIKENFHKTKEKSSKSKENFQKIREKKPPKIKDELPKNREETCSKTNDESPKGKEKTQKIEEKTPKIEEKTPKIEEKTPKIEEKIPKIEEKTPKIEEKIQKTVEKTPKIEEKTPKIEEKIPKTVEKTPKSKEKTSKIDEKSTKSKQNFQKIKEENFANSQNENFQKIKESFQKAKEEKSSKSEKPFQKIKEESPKIKEHFEIIKDENFQKIKESFEKIEQNFQPHKHVPNVNRKSISIDQFKPKLLYLDQSIVNDTAPLSSLKKRTQFGRFKTNRIPVPIRNYNVRSIRLPVLKSDLTGKGGLGHHFKSRIPIKNTNNMVPLNDIKHQNGTNHNKQRHRKSSKSIKKQHVTTKTKTIKLNKCTNDDDHHNEMKRNFLFDLPNDILPSWLTTSKERRSSLTSPFLNSDDNYANMNRRQLLGILRTYSWYRKRARKMHGDNVRYLRYLTERKSSYGAQAADMWKRKYADELRDTHILREQIRRLRRHLYMLRQAASMVINNNNNNNSGTGTGNALAKHPLSQAQVQAPPTEPSNQASLKTSATKLIEEIEKVGREVDTAKINLVAQSKMKLQVEKEVKILRTEATERKINAAVSRTQVGLQPLNLLTTPPSLNLIATEQYNYIYRINSNSNLNLNS